MKRHLSLQDLELRRLLAAAVGNTGVGDSCSVPAEFGSAGFALAESAPLLASTSTAEGEGARGAEGEPADDLVAFAKALTDANVRLFGAAWDSDSSNQREAFGDGSRYLDFVESTSADRSLNSDAIDNQITELPTWLRGDGQQLTDVQSLEAISLFAGVDIPQGETPSFFPIERLIVRHGSPLHLPIDAYDPNGGPLTVTVSVDRPELLSAEVLTGNRSIRMDLDGYEDMVFELFEDRAPTASTRVIELAQQNFYDGVLFHRVVDDFVIQAGDPTSIGTGGSTLPDFDDEYHVDLQHNRSGVLSFAKSDDDTNNSQFFITEDATRQLDFQHSVFGQLVEGDRVRESISEVAVNTDDRPEDDAVISDVDVFTDTENAVVFFKVVGDNVGEVNVTITVTDEQNNSFSQTVVVEVGLDNVNSNPFLNPIIVPEAGPVGRSQQIQLTSTDIENDTVRYSATLLTSTSEIQGSFNDDGLLTITPSATLQGTIDIQVFVAPADAPAGIRSDSQVISLTFDPTITPPPLIDLDAGSDSGMSDSDDLTNAPTLVFNVIDTEASDVVELFADGELIETLSATGTAATFSTTALTDLGQGTFDVSVRTTRGNEILVGNTITVTYDTVAPKIDAATLAESIVVGETSSSELGLLLIDEIDAELRRGNPTSSTVSITNAPDGMELSTSTLTWTPTANQLGPNTFRLQTADAAGNRQIETFAIDVLPAVNTDPPLVAISLRLTDTEGNAIDSVQVGQPFFVVMAADDLRISLDRFGVYSAYADVLFDSEMFARPSPFHGIEHLGDFTLASSGLVGNGQIDELGAANTQTTASLESSSVIARFAMTAMQHGPATLTTNPADDTVNEVLLFGDDNVIDPARVQYNELSFSVEAPWHREAEPADVNGMDGVSPLDALAIINAIGSQGGPFAVYTVDRSEFPNDFRYDVIPDGLISPRDALVVINTIARQSAPAGNSGEGEAADLVFAESDFLASPSWHARESFASNELQEDEWLNQLIK